MEPMEMLTNHITRELKEQGIVVPEGSYGWQVKNLGNVPATNPEGTTQQFFVQVTGILPKK